MFHSALVLGICSDIIMADILGITAVIGAVIMEGIGADITAGMEGITNSDSAE